MVFCVVSNYQAPLPIIIHNPPNILAESRDMGFFKNILIFDFAPYKESFISSPILTKHHTGDQIGISNLFSIGPQEDIYGGPYYRSSFPFVWFRERETSVVKLDILNAGSHPVSNIFSGGMPAIYEFRPYGEMLSRAYRVGSQTDDNAQVSSHLLLSIVFLLLDNSISQSEISLHGGGNSTHSISGPTSMRYRLSRLQGLATTTKPGISGHSIGSAPQQNIRYNQENVEDKSGPFIPMALLFTLGGLLLILFATEKYNWSPIVFAVSFAGAAAIWDSWLIYGLWCSP
jgi:hypothetical protein